MSDATGLNELSTLRQVKIGRAADVPEGQGKDFVVEGRRLALFRANGQYYVISDRCLHRGGPLSAGELDDYTVTCPWHGWKYDVRTGAFEIIPTLKVKSYRVEQKGEDLYLSLD